MSLNDVEEVRNRIARVEREDYRYCLMTTYLFDARISEVVANACPKDTTVARGPKGSDAKLDNFVQSGTEIPCVVFTVKTAKRQGKLRYISLPLAEECEPWSKPLYGYFISAGAKPVFNFTRQTIWKYVKDMEVFKGLKCPIDRYIITDKVTLEKKPIPAHDRKFMLHALRHLRASELVGFYGFDGFNLATYGGWTYHTMAQTSVIMDRYLSLSWQSYFPKLLKKRR
jgi:hypothetical protein